MFTQQQAITAASIVRGFYEARAAYFWYDLEGADSEVNQFLVESSTTIEEVFTSHPGKYSEADVAISVGAFVFNHFSDTDDLPEFQEVSEYALSVIEAMEED